MEKGPWLWWLWLFILKNEKSKEKPKQIAIVWTTKNVDSATKNGKVLFSKGHKGTKGAVAAWFFDGKKMHENIVLEKCDVIVSRNELHSTGNTKTSFCSENEKYVVRIGDDFKLIAKNDNKNALSVPFHTTYIPISGKGLSEIKANRMEVSGKIMGEKVNGTAYFQRVFADSPLIPWEWGLFHFENGGILTYGNHNIFGKSFNQFLEFSDGNKTYKFNEIRIKMTDNDLPVFHVEGENSSEKVKVKIASYAKSFWEFKENVLFVIPESVTYREYLSTITSFELINKRNGEKIGMKNLGAGVGNVEHTTGFIQ